MTYIADLADGNKVIPVGYLAKGHEYSKGEVSEESFDRLVLLAKRPLASWFGYHTCDLGPCGSGEPQPKLYYQELVIPDKCSTDILVPAEGIVYVAPALILHYIRRHGYLPPACFLEAALRCPEPGSNEYIEAINKVGVAFYQFPLREHLDDRIRRL